MRTSFLLTGIAALSMTAAAAAEPPKAPVRSADQPAERSTPVVVASADEPPQVPATDQDVSAPAKPIRHARVTTCRCGDQNPNN